MRACHTNNCPVGIATQKPHLTARIHIEKSAERLARFMETSVELMKILARACGHTHLNQLSIDDLITWKHDMARLAGVPYGGVGHA
jgi:glutamate synthase domain-containing protein 2